MGYTFMVPAKIISGENVIAELGKRIEGKGKKALIVTDSFMVKFGNVAKVEDALKKAGLPYVIFDGANSEPTDKIVEAGLGVYQQEGCDFIIALGGAVPWIQPRPSVLCRRYLWERKSVLSCIKISIWKFRTWWLFRLRLVRAVK